MGYLHSWSGISQQLRHLEIWRLLWTTMLSSGFSILVEIVLPQTLGFDSCVKRPWTQWNQAALLVCTYLKTGCKKTENLGNITLYNITEMERRISNRKIDRAENLTKVTQNYKDFMLQYQCK